MHMGVRGTCQCAAGHRRGRFRRKRLGLVGSQSAPQPLPGAGSLWGDGWRPTSQAAVIKAIGATGGGSEGLAPGSLSRALGPALRRGGGRDLQRRPPAAYRTTPHATDPGDTRPFVPSPGRPPAGLRPSPVKGVVSLKRRGRWRSLGGAACSCGRQGGRQDGLGLEARAVGDPAEGEMSQSLTGRGGSRGRRPGWGRRGALGAGGAARDAGPQGARAGGPRPGGALPSAREDSRWGTRGPSQSQGGRPPNAVAARGAGYLSEGPDSLSPSLPGGLHCSQRRNQNPEIACRGQARPGQGSASTGQQCPLVAAVASAGAKGRPRSGLRADPGR